MFLRRKTLITLLLSFLLCTASWVAGSAQDNSNLAALKKGIELFNSVLNQSLTQNFGGPFETLDRARGAYLPGYGVIFTFEVNLTPSPQYGPFGPAPKPKSEQAQREEEVRRRDRAESVAEQILGNFGQALTPLAPEESVAIIIQTVAAQPGNIARSTIVIAAPKKLLDERESNSIDQAQFVKKLSVTEY